ncbi:MAG: CHAT domain-containing protein [Microcoleus sp. PH2017_10_PVI_O_A]|uniref:CHAT domain-containing protein n=1 Tax=unclassified Microcoleus TaxID=2642155 RepID=UPI001D4C7C9A|nr:MULTISPECIES: CHAT domain-containing tetratricopeptide repeat protein [unclassified Microcoleus]TAE78335.1 MAG: CHAT domain-containing protein [Oscillatoriales cyanobacterium]MCC3408817.1 CHAT domain-containing protein [Microcoleus sp. PH2017_10_PVI_O_A]MCC3462952.1 CHAT domain-containing protein [Microcoleus sp. PH2017_11_PCY_U_A]MCC3481349.1 CHAT domain-containing protein [Microcoleus sp. PH2017_12_PCY_D_A]MCC3562378.1 CHAT domain-containing protein [Microcoleus sp. PH2017_27_LUM_O_A]
MNEERQNAYQNLIDRLLRCASGEESQILKANLDLVDVGLVAEIVKVAEDLEERGDRNTADFLIDIARELAEALGLSSPSSQLTFLSQVLQATQDSDGNRQVVYPLLQSNLDKLDDNFAELLRSWATARMSEVEPGQAQFIAAVIGNFSNLIREFPQGKRAINLEISITGYKFVATVFTCEAFPQEWATSQNNLGTAYFDRIRGKKTENLEVAISYYKAALQEYTREAFPQEWATIQNGLGNVYVKRIEGKRVDNLETGIRYYQAALEIRTPSDSPQQWATTQHNLGTAYRNRIRGERAENLEEAIRCYNGALEVRIRQVFPQHYRAETQINLGVAYSERIREKRAENLEEAIGCYDAALEVLTYEAFPERWATLQNNLGTVYYDRIEGERAENLESAIGYYKAALQVRTPQDFPEEWGDTQNNLGISYHNRIHGERSENMEAAIHCYLAALRVRTRKDLPEQWGDTLNNLGNVYKNRTWGKPTKNLKVAIGCFLSALVVRKRETYPQDFAITQFNLGLAYQKSQQFPKAYKALDAAIETVESLRDEIISGSGIEADKKKLAEKWNNLYRGIVKVSIELAKDEPRYYQQAIKYAERSKTRNLVELILNRDLKTIFPPDVVTQLEQLRDEIASGQYQLQTATADNPTALAQYLQQLRQQRNELQDRYLPIGYGFKFDQFQATLDDHTAIIQWYITSAGFETFIITRHSLQKLILSTPSDDMNALIEWANEYLDAYGRKIKSQFINSLASRLSCLAEILHLEDILKLVSETCDRLILIPHRYLHLFPLHAMPLANGDFLCDRFPNGVGYAPSCQMLQLAHKREQHRNDFSHLLAIQNPTRTDLSVLTGTEIQLEKICQHFDSDHSIVLREKEATEAALITELVRFPHCLHFCCHGFFDFGSPLKSALRLAESEGKLCADADLTLGKIFEKLNLDQCRLVTFSACQTGITDPTSISDEYVGLISAFLYAGSPSVVSTLWSVEQTATNLFMIEFYNNLKQLVPLKPGSVAISLNKTQKWLRTLTGEELRKIVESPEFQRHLDDENNKLFKESLDRAKLKPYPFEKPYYWAAFVATGL